MLCLFPNGCVLSHFSCVWLCNSTDYSLPGSSAHGVSPGKNTGMGCHALLQGIFPTQGSNPGLLHCKWIRCHLSHQFWFFSFTTWEVSCQFLLASGFWCEIHVTLFSSYVEDIVSLLLLSRLFSRPLVFRSLTVVYLDVDFFGLILFRIHSTSSICRFMSFATQKIFGHFFFEYFPVPPSFSCPIAHQWEKSQPFCYMPTGPQGSVYFFPHSFVSQTHVVTSPVWFVALM